MSTATTHIKTDKQLVPALRFKEFDGEWERSYVNDLASKLKVGFVGTCEPYYTTSEEGVLLVRTGNLKGVHIELDEEKYVTRAFHDKNKKSQIYPGDLLLARHGGNGEICRVPEDFPTANCLNIVILRTNSELKSEYFQLVYSSFAVQKQISAVTAGSTQVVINTKEIGKLKIVYPQLPEQQKIATFLSAVDEKIQQLTKKKALLEQYKKGVMQQLFSGQLRFKDENGNPYPDWEEAVMQDVFERVKEKNKENNLNVMSISAQQGLVNQLEYFNRYVSAADVTGYYLLTKGDFAYNKSYSKGYPMGAIKRLDLYDKGVVSTLYICFRIKENDDSTFYKEFLDHGGINEGLHKIAQEGARNHGLLNMSVIEFFRDIKIPRPSTEEQIVIGKFLEDLSIKIESAKNELTQTQTFKKGLLQQMFV